MPCVYVTPPGDRTRTDGRQGAPGVRWFRYIGTDVLERADGLRSTPIVHDGTLLDVLVLQHGTAHPRKVTEAWPHLVDELGGFDGDPTEVAIRYGEAVEPYHPELARRIPVPREAEAWEVSLYDRVPGLLQLTNADRAELGAWLRSRGIT